MRSILARLLLLVFCVPFGALAQTITIGLAADVTSIDPHFHVLGPNQNIAEHVAASDAAWQPVSKAPVISL